MKIAVVGTGYVGLVSGACFAEMGLDITCVDVDRKKIDALNNGLIPIYEPGLEELVKRNVEEGRLHFTTELTDCLDKVEVVFSAVGTPPDEDGSADLKYVLEVARAFGRNIKKYTVLVTKSTVPVGTAQKVKAVIREEIDKRGCKIPFDVASNPEFLKEGAAIKDFMSPDRVVVGIESERARKLMTRLYRPFLINNFRVLFMDIPSAEMTKYAANAMLATRISFMNEIANLCDLVGANVEMVRKGIGSDARIGSKFLYPGCGYGGSCFPKDVKALARTAQEHGYTMQVIEAVERVNEGQKSILFGKLQRALGDLHGKTIAIWGLAFKPETDDMREAPALVVIDLLRKAGATVRVYDPVAMEEARRRIGDEGVHYAGSMYEAAKGADAIALVTEWKQFRMPDWPQLLTLMRDNILVDGRNIFDKEEVLNAGHNVVVLAHAAITKFEQPDAVGNYDRWSMKTSKQVAPLLREWCDMLLFANYKTVVEKAGSGPNAKNKASGGRRVMYTTHHPCWDAKNRFGLPDEMPFDYADIAACISGTTPAPAPQPEPPAETVPKALLVPDLIALGVPEKLAPLMSANNVTPEELQHVVGERGYFPEDMPIKDYPMDFVEGCLIAAWPQVLQMVLDSRDLPF